MLPKKLNLKAIKARWAEFFESTNAAQPLKERKRKMADGTVKTDYVPSKVLSDGVLATGKELILLYVTAYEDAMSRGLDDEQPYMPMSGPVIGQICGVSDRASRTRMNKLKDCGFLLTKFCGRTHHYKVWIMPAFLFPELLEAGHPLQKVTPKTPDFTPNWNKLPPKALETTGYIEKEITHVDIKGVAVQQNVLPTGEDAGNTTGNILTGNTGAHQGLISAKEEPARPLAAKKQDTGAGAAAAAKKPAINAVFLFYIESFWSFAKHLLYPGEEFFPEEERMAKAAVWRGVYREFSTDFTDKEWEQYHDEAMQRLDMAANYYRNHPEKYAPKPYAQFVAGTGYFDWENTRGFRATHEWLVKHDVWKRQQRVNDALRRARADFRQHKNGKAPKRLQEKSLLQLFHFHESKFKKLGKDALAKFYKQHSINP